MTDRGSGVARWALALAALCLACRSNPHDDAVTGGLGGVSGGGGASGAATGGTGAGGAGDCPLDAIGKQRLKTVFDAVLEDAEYVASGSHGIGLGAMRAFGTRIAYSTLILRKSMTVTELCAGPMSFDPNCAAPEPGATGTFSRCVQLTCEDAGVLSAKIWIDPLPAELVQEPAPGTIELEQLESRTRYTEASDGSLAIALDGLVKIKLADGSLIERTIGGDFLNDAPAGSTLDILSSIDGIATKTVALDATRESGSLLGDVLVDGVPIATIDENGILFVGGCGG